jgi:hypothetical protein
MEVLKKYAVHLKSLSPLIMHSDKLCNPLDPLTKQMKEITKIRKKQDEHYLAMAKLEWTAAIYYDDETGIYIPSKCLLGCFKSAARKFKQGKNTKAVTIDCVAGTPLIGYEKINPETLWGKTNKKGEQEHVFANTVVVNKSRIVRTLPIFHKWEAKFNLYLNLEILSEEELQTIIQTAGFEYGLCELRPEKASGTYGRFSLESFKQVK